MIRVVTLDPFEEKDIAALCRYLHQAYGVGCEPAGSVALPEEAESEEVKGAYDAMTFILEAQSVKLVADDKLLFVTKQPLVQPEGPLGRPPTHGLAELGGQRAVLTTAGFPKGLEEGTEEFQKRLAKQAVREIGRTWELHSCLDPKCAMHPSWAGPFETNVEPVLCTFCRERSEEHMRQAAG